MMQQTHFHKIIATHVNATRKTRTPVFGTLWATQSTQLEADLHTVS